MFRAIPPIYIQRLNLESKPKFSQLGVCVSSSEAHAHIHIYIKINTEHKTIWSFLSSVFNNVALEKWFNWHEICWENQHM